MNHDELVDENDLAALLRPMAAKPAATTPAAPAGTTPAPPRRPARVAQGKPQTALQQRREAEKRANKRPVAVDDGRRLRATGRTVQLSLRVTPETKETLLAVQRELNRTGTSLIEEAIAALADKYLTEKT